MQRILRIKITLSFLLLLFSVTTFAQEDISSSAPSMPQSGNYRPSGFKRCDLIPSGFRYGSWETMHFKCHYKHHSIYETGYFKCTNQHRRSCHRWGWIPGHWVLR